MKISETDKPYTPWRVYLGKKTTGTRSARKFFATEDEAVAYVVRVKQQGFQNADDRRGSLQPGQFVFSECSAMWLAKQRGKKGFTMVKRVLRSLDKQFGRRAIETITHRDLDSWSDRIGGGYVNHLNYHRIARRFFKWAHEWLEAVTVNPMVKVTKPTGERHPVEIFTPDAMLDCLAAATLLDSPDDLRLTAYLCLGGFAGIRTEEILRMDWEDIDWLSGEIYIRHPKKVRGWKPRWVEIMPALRRNLESVALKTGKIVPGGQRTIYCARRDVMDYLFWDRWPKNGLRHSFKSYHLAQYQDAEKTQHQMGHADKNMTKYQYGTPEARRAAVSWWAL
jgi:integrase